MYFYNSNYLEGYYVQMNTSAYPKGTPKGSLATYTKTTPINGSNFNPYSDYKPDFLWEVDFSSSSSSNLTNSNLYNVGSNISYDPSNALNSGTNAYNFYSTFQIPVTYNGNTSGMYIVQGGIDIAGSYLSYDPSSSDMISTSSTGIVFYFIPYNYTMTISYPISLPYLVNIQDQANQSVYALAVENNTNNDTVNGPIVCDVNKSSSVNCFSNVNGTYYMYSWEYNSSGYIYMPDFEGYNFYLGFLGDGNPSQIDLVLDNPSMSSPYNYKTSYSMSVTDNGTLQFYNSSNNNYIALNLSNNNIMLASTSDCQGSSYSCEWSTS